MKKILLLCCTMMCLQHLWSQPVHLDSTYAVRQETLYYAAPTNYRGCVDSLYMTRYIPINTRTDRPIVVLVHGGGFVAGNRHNGTNNLLGLRLAARGYHVATVDYRLGYHIPSNINASFGCVIFNAIMNYPLDACMYPADTSEIMRAIYRGTQDVKTALRFLKSRSLQDS
jgi:pimeloyl-ACP methyl ester carboxylesterase